MNRYMLVLGSLLLSLIANAQTVQNGFVKEYNEELEKTPLENVELVITNAGTTISAPDGGFSLVFRTLQPGSHVAVRRIEKLNYEVFNKEALEQWNINPDRPFTIVMCRSDRFKRIRDNYSALSSRSYAAQKAKEERQLKEQLDAGLIQQSEYEEEIRRITFDYEEKLENLDTYIDKFARIDLSEISHEEYEIIMLIQEGNFEEAIIKYESMNLLDLYSQEVSDRNKIEEDIDRLQDVKTEKSLNIQGIRSKILNQVNAYKLAGGRENYDKALSMLKSVADTDTTSLGIVWEYASFCLEQSIYDEALKYFNVYDRNCRILSEKAAVNKALGEVYYGLNEYDKADEYYSLSIEQYKELNSTNVIEAYLDQASLYLEMRRLSSALDIYQSILNFYAENPSESEDYEHSFAGVNLYVGETMFLMNRIVEAERRLIEAYALFKELYDIFPDKYAPSIAKIQLYLGQIYRMNFRYEESEFMFKEALSGYERLYQKNPNAYQYDYAMALSKATVLFRELSRLEEATLYTNKSMELIGGLYSQYAAAYKPDKMRMMVQMADLYRSMGRYKECERLSLQVFSDSEGLYERYPEVFGYDMAKNSSNLGVIYTTQNKFAEAEKCFLQAYDYMYPLYKDDPLIYLNDMRMVYNNLGAFYDMSKFDLDESERYHNLALELVNKLSELYPGFYEREKMTTYSNLTLLYGKLQRLDEAAECSLKALDLAQMIYDCSPQAGLSLLIARLNERASIYSKLDDVEGQMECYMEMYRFAKDADKNNPGIYYRTLAKACQNLGFLLLTEDDMLSAEAYLSEGYSYMEILYNGEADAYLSEMALWNAIMTAFYMQTDDYISAEKYALKAVALNKSLYLQTPVRFWYQYVSSCQQIALLCFAALEDNERAIQYDIEAVSIMDKNTGGDIRGYISEYIESYWRLARIYKESENYVRAMEFLDKLIVIDASPSYLIYKAELLYNSGRIDESKDFFKKISENCREYLDENPSDIYNLLMNCNE